MDTSINPLPSFSAKGYIYDLQDRCDRLMSYFFSSQYSESYLYSGAISSLQTVLQRFGSDPLSFTQNLKLVLTTYFNAYFPNGVEVHVRDDSTTGTNTSSQYNVWMSVQITEGSKTYSLNEQILKKDSSFQRVLNAVNYGKY